MFNAARQLSHSKTDFNWHLNNNVYHSIEYVWTLKLKVYMNGLKFIPHHAHVRSNFILNIKHKTLWIYCKRDNYLQKDVRNNRSSYNSNQGTKSRIKHIDMKQSGIINTNSLFYVKTMIQLYLFKENG